MATGLCPLAQPGITVLAQECSTKLPLGQQSDLISLQFICSQFLMNCLYTRLETFYLFMFIISFYRSWEHFHTFTLMMIHFSKFPNMSCQRVIAENDIQFHNKLLPPIDENFPLPTVLNGDPSPH